MEGKQVEPELLLHDEYTYWECADNWGWTPDQVDACPGILLDHMTRLAGIANVIRAKASSE